MIIFITFFVSTIPWEHHYKFCAKMLKECKTLLEVGCGDSFGTAIVLQVVDRIHAVDIEPLVIKDNQQRVEYGERCSYEILDITTSSTKEQFEGGFSLDVIEYAGYYRTAHFLFCMGVGVKG